MQNKLTRECIHVFDPNRTQCMAVTTVSRANRRGTEVKAPAWNSYSTRHKLLTMQLRNITTVDAKYYVYIV